MVMFPEPVDAIRWITPDDPRAVKVIALREDVPANPRLMSALCVNVDGDMDWVPSSTIEWDTLKPSIAREMHAVSLWQREVAQ